jgi:hypothetical protein
VKPTNPERINMTTTKTTTTEREIAASLIESVPHSFMDSGDVYGRAYSTNRERIRRGLGLREDVRVTVDHALAFFSTEPEGTNDPWPVVSVFSYLKDRLDYHRYLTRAFRMWVYSGEVDQDGRTRYTNSFEVFDGWLDAFAERHGLEVEKNGSWYTYNEENVLSQDILGYEFGIEGGDHEGTYVALMVHGGCDARGGFSDIKVYQVEPFFAHDIDSFEFACPNYGDDCSSAGACREGEWEVDGDYSFKPAFTGKFGETPSCPHCADHPPFNIFAPSPSF